MRKSIIALALAGASAFACATGPYDGVYGAIGSTNYVVVMQNGSTLATAVLATVSNAPTVSWGSATKGYVTPSQIGTWVVAIGPIIGNNATLTSTSDTSACTTVTSVRFDGAGNLTATDTSSTPTALGLASGYKCWPAGSGVPVNMTRVF